LSITVNNPDRFIERPSAVLFDLDNTLYFYDPAHEAGNLAVVDKATNSLGVDSQEFNEALARARNDVKQQLGPTASSHSRLLYYQRTLEYLGLRSQVLLSLEFEQTYWRNFLSAVELREGTVSFLDLLARTGIPKVIVTDLTSQIQFRKLIYLDLDQRFEYVVTSEESGADKPDRAGFDLAIGKLPPQTGSIWMIGDNISSDIEGAKNAIDATTLVPKSEIGDNANNPAIDLVFDTFTDLEQLFNESGWSKPTSD
jgi:HAD superfamily hydrolase (TIGR01549 family)